MIPATVPAETIRQLATTRPAPAGSAALRAALHARRMLLLKALLVRVERAGASLTPAARGRFEADWALLERAEHADPAAVRALLDYPMTGAWLTAALAADEGPALEGQLAQLSGVALAAAVRAGCAVSGERAVPSGVLVLPGLGVLHCPSGRVLFGGDPGLVRIGDFAGRTEVLLARGGPGGRPVGGGTGWSGLRALPGSAVLLDDLDPYRVPAQGIGREALPAVGRPHSTPGRWAERWLAARALLAAVDPDRVAENGAVLRAVVPLAPSGRTHGPPMSATLRAAPGAMLSQLPDDADRLAEMLVHETQHTKLATLHELVPLYRPGGARYRVGWRTDPRPVPGVLQGAYAHLALTDLWRRVRAGPAGPDGWRTRAGHQFEVSWDQVGEALSILRESDELTFTGREFVQEMERRHADLGVAARSPG
ncbi:HEXXH motif-containing putative peptide modification protein [Streptomyces sp. FXJ1.172]|uniref:aKG-HExxH-type peptide beta-hydroxylase n=1 Tax=Streptomyces sp. FXJ1.172 TaxID=710705 RepID=UPI0007CF220A|nr:HEXXH motif-containing putative peptide modification protein [Streptomyces sp. FXJ1.172]WEO95375.1 HEXXH motif-containing putative peptide modification protein [Streptomyces sp. FXJ1.172]